NANGKGLSLRVGSRGSYGCFRNSTKFLLHRARVQRGNMSPVGRNPGRWNSGHAHVPGPAQVWPVADEETAKSPGSHQEPRSAKRLGSTVTRRGFLDRTAGCTAIKRLGQPFSTWAASEWAWISMRQRLSVRKWRCLIQPTQRWPFFSHNFAGCAEG